MKCIQSGGGRCESIQQYEREERGWLNGESECEMGDCEHAEELTGTKY